jgi:predicted CopG family antitoxin
MATKTISITEDAYRRLASLRKNNESFSEIIVEITGKTDFDQYFGILSKEAADEIEKSIIEGRKRHQKTRMQRIERIKEAFINT